MTPHAYTKAPNADLCTCGKVLFHEDHFGGSRSAAARAYSDMKLAREFPEPPAFGTVEEADAWLEQRAREMGIYVEPTPEFATMVEADAWLAERAATEATAKERLRQLLQESIAVHRDPTYHHPVKWDMGGYESRTLTWDTNTVSQVSGSGYTRGGVTWGESFTVQPGATVTWT